MQSAEVGLWKGGRIRGVPGRPLSGGSAEFNGLPVHPLLLCSLRVHCLFRAICLHPFTSAYPLPLGPVGRDRKPLIVIILFGTGRDSVKVLLYNRLPASLGERVQVLRF